MSATTTPPQQSGLDRPLLGPRFAKYAAVIATIGIMVILFRHHAGLHVVVHWWLWMAGGLYLTAVTWRVWGERLYKNGMSWLEVLETFAWPVGLAPYVRERIGTQPKTLPSRSRHSSRYRLSGNRVSERAILIGSCVVGLGGLVMMCEGVLIFVMSLSTFLALAVKIWAVGAIITLWARKPHESGISPITLIVVALWPLRVILGRKAAHQGKA